MPLSLRALKGVARSLAVYRLDRRHAAGLRAFYRGFVRAEDLVFDVGAHVGDRVSAFRALGARVVAVEPQPLLVAVLRLLHGRDRGVRIEPVALGPAEGAATLKVNSANPTVSTRSDAFLDATRDAPGWEGQAWDTELKVRSTTLDALIARHGMPAFLKIDVEGFEAEVLSGLTQRPPALSFEIVTAARAAGLDALAQARALGFTQFRLSLGESHEWSGPWCDGDAMAATLAGLPDEANSGDVYAVTDGHPMLAA